MSRFKKQDLVSQNTETGKWSTIQMAPDIITGEKLNIGVAYISHQGLVKTRFAPNLEKLKCLYPNINIETFENSMSALQVLMEGAKIDHINKLDLYENFNLSVPKPAKGHDADQILSRLFKQMVPLAHETRNKKETFKAIRTSELRRNVYTGMLERLGEQRLKEYIHPNPWRVNVPGQNKTIDLDLPLRNNASQKAGTIVSGWYASDDKVKLALYQSAIDIRTAMDYISDEKFGFFMLRPDKHSGLSRKTLEKIDRAIDDQAERLHHLGVTIELSDKIEELTDRTTNWLVA